MRRTRHLAFIVTVWAATVAPGFAQPRDLTGVGTDYVALVYDDSSIPDGDRAALVTFVAAAVPVEKWPVVTVTASTHIHCLIDDFYDYYPNGAFQTPRTVDALQTAIVRSDSERPSRRCCCGYHPSQCTRITRDDGRQSGGFMTRKSEVTASLCKGPTRGPPCQRRPESWAGRSVRRHPAR